MRTSTIEKLEAELREEIAVFRDPKLAYEDGRLIVSFFRARKLWGAGLVLAGCTAEFKARWLREMIEDVRDLKRRDGRAPS